MTTIRLNDGTTAPVEWCGVADGVLVMELTEPMTIPEALALLTPERMQHVTFHYGEMADEHEGYTLLVAVSRNITTGRVTASHRKELS